MCGSARGRGFLRRLASACALGLLRSGRVRVLLLRLCVVLGSVVRRLRLPRRRPSPRRDHAQGLLGLHVAPHQQHARSGDRPIQPSTRSWSCSSVSWSSFTGGEPAPPSAVALAGSVVARADRGGHGRGALGGAGGLLLGCSRRLRERGVLERELALLERHQGLERLLHAPEDRRDLGDARVAAGARLLGHASPGSSRRPPGAARRDRSPHRGGGPRRRARAGSLPASAACRSSSPARSSWPAGAPPAGASARPCRRARSSWIARDSACWVAGP